MTSLNQIFWKVLKSFPAPIKEFLRPIYYSYRQKALLAELAVVPIIHSGIEDIGGGGKNPYVTLQNGIILCGHWPSERQKDLYDRYYAKISPRITKDTIGVAVDVITRYLYPHAMPQLTLPYSRRARKIFHPQHIETISDLRMCSDSEKEQLKGIFSPVKGELFFDVGAYMGYGSIRLSEDIGSSGRIIALEAHPDNFRLLKFNIQVNNLSNITFIPKAVWSQGREVLDLHVTQRQANSLVIGIVEAVETIPIQTVTIDELVKKEGCPNLISITINGAEVEAVKGMRATLERCKKIRLSIAGWYKLDSIRICDIIAPTLQEAGFRVFVGELGGVLAWKGY